MNKLIKDITITSDKSLSDALKKMALSNCKTLIIVSKNNKILGTLSDGDIRRKLIDNNSNLQSKISNIYNKKPIFISNDNYNEKSLEKIFFENRIDLVPVIDNKKNLVDIINVYDFFNKSKKIKKTKIPVLIMAGGMGLRMGDITNHIPKPLIPIKDKTMINNIIDNFVKSGHSKYYITINYKSALIKAYFRELKLNVDIKFISEKTPLGTAGSIYFLKNEKIDNFFITNCDTFVNYDFKKIVKFHIDFKNDLTLVLIKKSFKFNYGVCRVDSEKNVLEINEKPEINNLINSGIYLFNKNIFKLIKKNQKIDMDVLIEKAIKSNLKIKGYFIDESNWIDLGDNNKIRNYF